MYPPNQPKNHPHIRPKSRFFSPLFGVLRHLHLGFVPTRLLVATAHPYGVPLALRDAGYEVIYVGEQPAEALIEAAKQEDVAAIVVARTPPGLSDAGLTVIETGDKDLDDLLALLR